ncbi:MAG: polysaccharide deacetylase family protein, partial [Candidatus Omnitrophica bacterium]|nr:polysaccharide deacetylase family protein [Candidatus Omnitrophota bacterium]
YHSGQTQQALASLEKLVEQHPEYQPALTLLINHAMVHQDWVQAARLLEYQLADPKPTDAPFFIKLAKVYQQLGRTEDYLRALDQCLKLDLAQAEALLLKAEYFESKGRFAAAVNAYQEILARNPWSLQALSGLADAQYSRGHYTQAIRLIERTRRLDPTDPYWTITHARYLHNQGNIKESKQLLNQSLQASQEPVLLVLLYHGLVTSASDPLLVSPIHLTVATFEDHMRALHQAGFFAVTAEEVSAWYQGTLELPKNPVLITFDDARLDSFEHADPILAQYGLKATMFVPVTNIEKDLPGYASWSQIDHYQQTGRWQIQSHGDRASEYIPRDGEGRRGLFLVHRQWLADEQRLETPKEWQQRIAEDYRQAKQRLAQKLGNAPNAFAYPESNFGQDGISNVKDAARVNLELVRKNYHIAFHQDGYGLNIHSKDPFTLTRLEPKSSWSGEDLLRHVAYEDPFLQTRLTLLRQSVWQGRLKEARQWLESMRQAGTPESLLLMEQARLHFAAGDPIHGRSYLDRALQAQPTAEVLQAAEALRHNESQWAWAPSVWFSQDNRSREHLTLDQQVGSWQIGSTLWHVNHRSGLFREADIPDVVGHAGGLGSSINLGLDHRLEMDVLGYVFSGGQASETFSAAGKLHSQWTDEFSTQLGLGVIPVETARALNADVQDRNVELEAAWKSESAWQAALHGRASSLSDDNQRFTGVVEISKRLLKLLPAAELIYRFTADDTQVISPNYYSPQLLMLHQLGVHYSLQPWRWLGLSVRYLPGIGDEDGSDPRFIQAFELHAPFKRHDRIWLEPTFFVTRTPTYRSNRVGLMLEFRF